MSIRVMNWAWERSAATGGDLLVLLAIADHASDDGTDAFPLVDTLAAKCRMSPRSIQRAVSRLVELGELGVERNQGGLAATPVDRRPNRYTVLMDGAVDNPGRGDKLSPREPVENPERDDSCVTPGVTHVTERGDSAVTHNHPGTIPEPPPAREGATDPLVDSDPPGGGEDQTRAFLDALGTGWLLSPSQRRRLTPAVGNALTAGWRPVELAAYVGANTAGVRNPYAVLRARLGDLPDPPVPPQASESPVRAPEWCRSCDVAPVTGWSSARTGAGGVARGVTRWRPHHHLSLL